MRLSIIIPIYNVERYIEKCVMSCINQHEVNKDDYELILVNDGTKDNSFNIAKDITKGVTNVKYLDQENQGLSMARNNGLELATGDYVWFVDSDDWIESDAVSTILLSIKTKLDLLQIQFRYAYEDGSYKDSPKFVIDGVVSGPEQLLVSPLPAPAQFTIFRREFLVENNLKFMPGILHEDSEFKPRALYEAKNVGSTPVVLYNYLQRSTGAITSTYKIKNGFDAIKVMNSIYKYAKSSPKIYHPSFFNLIGLNLNTVVNGLRFLTEDEKEMLKRELLKQKHLFESLLRAKDFRYRIEGIMFIIAPLLFISVYSRMKN